MAVLKRNALKAALWYTLSNFVSKTILYLCTPLFTRILTKAEFGQYNNFLSWQNILLAIFAMDLSSSIAVAFFDYGEENDFRSFISTITLASVAIPLILSLGIIFFKEYFVLLFNMGWSHLLIMLANLTLGNTLQIYQLEQRTRLEYKLSSALTLMAAMGTVILTFILLYCFNDKLTAIIIGNVSFNIIISLVLLVILLKRKLTFEWKYLKFSLFISVPLIPHVLSGAITGSSGQILITKFCGSEKTALFGLAFTISMVITMFATSINKAWIPWFFDKLKKSDTGSIKYAIKQILPVFALGTIGFCLIAPEIIMLVGGTKYLETIYLMPPIILQCYFHYIYTLYVNIEFYEKKTYLIPIATIGTAIVNFGLNYILLQRFDYQIVAYNSLITGVLLLLLHYLVVKYMNKTYVFNNSFILKNILFTFVCCFLVMLLYKNTLARVFCCLLYIAVLLQLALKRKNVIKRYCSDLFR